MKFNMGCGQNHRVGYLNVDAYPASGPDEVWDLEMTPWPWPDGCAEEVIFHHSLEHMGGDPTVFLAIMKELYRICVDGAVVEIIAPHPRHNNFIDDPTHVRVITPNLMRLFDRELNEAWKASGASNSPLAIYAGVDFETTATQTVLDEPYVSQFRSGALSEAEVQEALKRHNNVATEFRIRLKARKSVKNLAPVSSSHG